jgi:outer membrane protein assembly factor BamB
VNTERRNLSYNDMYKGVSTMTTKDNRLVYVGFNSRVAALDKNTGEIVWDWKAPKGRGYVSILLLEDRRLIVSVVGYTYSLDALTGKQQWYNEMRGFGSGVASIVSLNASNPHDALLAAASADAQQSSASASAAAG